jgi:hypothetical protein
MTLKAEACMRGYIESFEFKRRVIHGWALDDTSSVNGDTEVVVRRDGISIGSGRPHGTRGDLKKVTTAQDLVYSVSCRTAFTPLDVISGRLEVHVLGHAGQATLAPTAGASLMLRRLVVQALMDTDLLGTFQPVRSLLSGGEISHAVDDARAGILSPVLLPVGLESRDKSARIGHSGHLFLTAGTNDLLQQYDAHFANVEGRLNSRVAQWKELVATRRHEAESRGITFYQTIIPEKLTALRKYAPIKIDGPTPLYAALDKELQSDSSYVSSLRLFDSWEEDDDPFLAADSHLSAAGAKAMIALLGRRIDPKVEKFVKGIALDTARYDMGDLSRRFYNLPIYCKFLEPSELQLRPFNKDLQQTKNFEPSRGHIGSWFAWRNETSPSPLRVTVFGNSFFGSGKIPREIAWWAKVIFREFNMVWSPSVDWSIVDELQPDILIGQSIERFLASVPNS